MNKADDKARMKRVEAARSEARKLNKRLPPHVYAEASAYGKLYVYYEKSKSAPKVRITSPFGTPEFDEELAAAKRGIRKTPPRTKAPPAAPAVQVHTWRWLCEEYFRNDTDFAAYADKRRRRTDIEATFDEKINPESSHVFGDCPLNRFDARAVLTLVERKLVQKQVLDDITGKTRTVITNRDAANQRRKWIAQVLKYGVRIGRIAQNYARDVERQKPENKDGFRTWTPEHRRQFEAAYALGTLPRLVYDLAFYTSARRADLPRLGTQMIQADRKGRETLVYIQHKNRNENPIKVYQPILPALKESIEAAKSSGVLGDMLFIVQTNSSGKPYTEESLGNKFRDWVKEAGLGDEGISLHGLRKAAVVNLIMNQCSIHEIMAITGHRSTREIERYGRDYMREIAAESVFDKWLQNQACAAAFDENEYVDANYA